MSTAVQQAPTPFAPTASQLEVAYSVCSGIARGAAKNFYYGFLALPKPKRQALCAVYAFMRRCDDIVDESSLPAIERQQKLDAWLDSVHRAFAGYPTDEPVLLALADAQRRFNIQVGLLDELAYGTAMDLESGTQTSPIAYPTFEALRLYCYRVASVVGLVCIRIFGYKDPAAEALAEKCGLAFQLTNIIRDVKEDAEMGRIYVPQEDLARFELTSADLKNPTDLGRVRPLLEFEAGRARECYQAGEELIPLIDEDSQPALWVLITIYRKLLNKIAARQFDVFQGKIKLTVREKLTVLLKGFAKRLL